MLAEAYLWSATSARAVDARQAWLRLRTIVVPVDVALVKLTLEVRHVVVVFIHFGDSAVLLTRHGVPRAELRTTRHRGGRGTGAELVWPLRSSEAASETWSAATACSKAMSGTLLLSVSVAWGIAYPHEREGIAKRVVIVFFAKVVRAVKLVARVLAIVA